jgi:hypothetical protein
MGGGLEGIEVLEVLKVRAPRELLKPKAYVEHLEHPGSPHLDS